jgi:hypothetical protein
MVRSIIYAHLFFLAIASATYTCDSSNAYIPGSSTDGSGSTGGDSSGGDASGSGSDTAVPSAVDPSVIQPAVDIGDAFADTGSSLYGLSGKRSLPSQLKSALQARDSSSLECQDSEACFLWSGSLLCIDPTTYNFEDNSGGAGNLNSGVYTMDNGQVTTIATTATGLPTPTSVAEAQSTASSLGSKNINGHHIAALGIVVVARGITGVLL